MTEDPSLLSEADSGGMGDVFECRSAVWDCISTQNAAPVFSCAVRPRVGPRSSSVAVPRGAQAPSPAARLSWHFRMQGDGSDMGCISNDIPTGPSSGTAAASSGTVAHGA